MAKFLMNALRVHNETYGQIFLNRCTDHEGWINLSIAGIESFSNAELSIAITLIIHVERQLNVSLYR